MCSVSWILDVGVFVGPRLGSGCIPHLFLQLSKSAVSLPGSALCIISSLKGLSPHLAVVVRAVMNVLELWFALILCWKAYLKEQR